MPLFEFSTEGATYDSPGRKPWAGREKPVLNAQGLRPGLEYAALSGLRFNFLPTFMLQSLNEVDIFGTVSK